MLTRFADEQSVMRRALQLAAQGEGFVEPNPQVGAVLVDSDLCLIAEGFHQAYGGPHAEVHALTAAGPRARGATLFCTLEPCSHFGKTPPCADAVIAAGVTRVVVAMSDPNPVVAGGGISRLQAAGLSVDVGLLESAARLLTAPFCKLIATGRPFVHAKWAMTLDGKSATVTGSSQWISNSESRSVVHRLRGRMDAIVTGSGTVIADDPLLTARPAGPRLATRIVLDSQAGLALDSQLVRTAATVPVIVAAEQSAPVDNVQRLREAGVEVLLLPPASTKSSSPTSRGRPSLSALMDELGRRRFTNVLIEAGGELLGACFDERLIDQVHAFIAPKLIGGRGAPTPLAGAGILEMSQAQSLVAPKIELCGDDIYICGKMSCSFPGPPPSGETR